MKFNTTEPAFRLRQGTWPLLISMPHVGTHVPPALAARFTPDARQVHDTDWHLERLYDFADAMGASVLVATHSRYVVDLNRPPDNQNLYPGQDTTGLCPVDTFDKTSVYSDGDVPDDAEIIARRDAIWQPYHQQLQAELSRLKAAHGTVVLWDAHSIRSVLPRFFEGRLLTSTSARPTAQAAIRNWRRRCLALAKQQALTKRFSTAASRAVTSPANTAARQMACMRFSWR